jgi:hypothetical protein
MDAAHRSLSKCAMSGKGGKGGTGGTDDGSRFELRIAPFSPVSRFTRRACLVRYLLDRSRCRHVAEPLPERPLQPLDGRFRGSGGFLT